MNDTNVNGDDRSECTLEMLSLKCGERIIRVRDKKSGIYLEKPIKRGTGMRAQTQIAVGELKSAVLEEKRLVQLYQLEGRG